MNEQLKNTLIEILTYFKRGLDDIEAGSEERQTMQNEIDFALPLVKKLLITDVVVPKGTLCDFEWHNSDIRRAYSCSECGGKKLK